MGQGVEAIGRPDCNTLFCALREHEGNVHTDVTGHSWVEETPAEPVIAKAYIFGEDRQ